MVGRASDAPGAMSIVRTLAGFDKHPRRNSRATPAERRSGASWLDWRMLRTGLAAILLVLLIPTVVAANASFWALRTVLDSETFSTTVGRTLDTPALQRLVATSLADGIVDRIGRASPAAVGVLASRLGLATGADPDRVSAALGKRILDAMDDPAVAEVRDEVVAAVHGSVIGVAEGKPGLVAVRGKDLVLDTTGLLDRIAAAADPRVASLVADVPTGLAGPIVIAQVAELEPIQDALALMEVLEQLLPLVAVTAALVVVVLAHRRTRALGIVGLALAVAGAASLLVLWLAGRYIAGVPDAPVARELTAQVYDAFMQTLVAQAVLLVVVGLFLAIVSWLLARSERRRATRRMLGPR